jgi:hypothetical protein
MPDLFAKLAQEWPVITGAPIIFTSAVIGAAVIIWIISQWSYKSRLDSRDAEIALVARQRDDFKDRLSDAVRHSPAPTAVNIAPNGGEGGKGGSGMINGNNGAIYGGRGGDGGSSSSGRGGDGGGGTITGDNGTIHGGEGGSAGGHDGRGGKATAPLPSLVSLPKEMWGAGRSGSGANAPEYSRRVALLIEIRREYMDVLPDTCPYILAGIDQVSPDWINARLSSIEETWKVQLSDGGYILPSLGTGRQPIVPEDETDRHLQKQCFDYSTNNGMVRVQHENAFFDLRFTKGSRDKIYLYKNSTNLVAIARIRGYSKNSLIDFSNLDSSSDHYMINVGEHFIAKSAAGQFLLGKILSLKDNSRGDTNDEVCFAYEFDQSGIGRFKPI